MTKQTHQSIRAPMGDKMDEDEPPRGGYKEALLSAAGKRDRPKAPTGLTPPAKADLGRKETRHKERTNRKCG